MTTEIKTITLKGHKLKIYKATNDKKYYAIEYLKNNRKIYFGDKNYE